MTRLLFLNPNSSRDTGMLIREVVESLLQPGESVHVESAVCGPGYLGSAEAIRTGTVSIFESARRCLAAQPGYHAIVQACFADLAPSELSARYGLPVVSLLGASIQQAGRHGARWSVVTAGHAWRELLPGMVQASPGFQGQGQLVSVRTFELNAPRDAITEPALRAEIERLAGLCRDTDGADVVILGGAGLAGLCRHRDNRHAFVMIDSTLAGLDLARELAKTSPKAWIDNNPLHP